MKMLWGKVFELTVTKLLRVPNQGTLNVETGGVFQLGGVTVAASAAELNRVAQVSSRIVNLAAATLSLTQALHDKRIVTLNRAAGSTITLPASSGGGAVYEVIIGTTLTSASLVIQVANVTDVMQGVIMTMSDDPATMKGFATAASSDTITWNRTTTGVGTAGEYVRLVDVAAGFWFVTGVTTSSGTEASPFSAAV
jgi:hypothetical protein